MIGTIWLIVGAIFLGATIVFIIGVCTADIEINFINILQTTIIAIFCTLCVFAVANILAIIAFNDGGMFGKLFKYMFLIVTFRGTTILFLILLIIQLFISGSVDNDFEVGSGIVLIGSIVMATLGYLANLIAILIYCESFGSFIIQGLFGFIAPFEGASGWIFYYIKCFFYLPFAI